MELLIIGGLAFVGYEISKNGQKSTNHVHKVIEKQEGEYPFKADPFLSNNPANMKYNSMQPFYRREGGMSLGSNNEIKTRTLEGFTGINNEDFQYKKEQECLFKPEENRQSIYGTPSIPSDVQNRYKSSLMMNNVSPVEKQQVGPGLNTDSNVSARGGFHQYYRILPTNVGDYKNNTLEEELLLVKVTQKTEQHRPNNQSTQRRHTMISVNIQQCQQKQHTMRLRITLR